ncbi:MAG: hypothetical protein J0H47_09070 [Gammaproteobacteria bacterium]|nr:hypothetical protein [Gammaproteobacteria bacterium]
MTLSHQSIYFTNESCVVNQMEALISGLNDIPRFNNETFINEVKALFPNFYELPGKRE